MALRRAAPLSDVFSASPTSLAYRAVYITREMLLRGLKARRDTGKAERCHSPRYISRRDTGNHEEQAITRTAAYSGKYSTAHYYTVNAIRSALHDGARWIESENFVVSETAEYCRDKGVALIPTRVTTQGMTQQTSLHFLDDVSQMNNQEVRRGGLDALTILGDAAVTSVLLI